MRNTFVQKIYYADTDAYGVVWHGSYIRWMEMGRVALCEDFGYKMSELEAQNIVLPVTEININYKSSAKFEDEIIDTGIDMFEKIVELEMKNKE